MSPSSMIACSRRKWSCTLWRAVTHFAEGGPLWYALPQVLGSVLQISVQVPVALCACEMLL